jgi:glycosyltransferase involved in cell wall biosynthesis
MKPSRPLRIGVNALYLIPGGVGGTEIYLRGLLPALAEIDSVNRYVVFTSREAGAQAAGSQLVPGHSNFRAAVQPVPAALRPARILWEQTCLPLIAAREQLDVLFNPGFTGPLFCPCPQVTVFHDLQHKRHPEFFRWFDLPFWRFFLYWSAHISKDLLAVSGMTAADLSRYYRIPPDRVQVAPLGVEPMFFEIGRRRRPEPFLLTASTLHPHKNLDRLLRAFAAFHRRRPDFRLVICGLPGFSTAHLHALRDALSLNDVVDFPGWIPREQLYDLFARAWAFIYPTRFEGFGLPVLEALAAGVPTACSAIEPLSGIADGAALQFDPADLAAIEQALLRVTEDAPLRDRLIRAGPRRAADFSWTATARKTLAVLSAAAQQT